MKTKNMRNRGNSYFNKTSVETYFDRFSEEGYQDIEPPESMIVNIPKV